MFAVRTPRDAEALGRSTRWDRAWVIEGWIIGLVGLAGLAGWVLGIRELIQPFASRAPISPYTAVAILALGVAATALGRGLDRVALTAIGITTLIVAAGLLYMATGFGPEFDALTFRPGVAVMPAGTLTSPFSLSSAFSLLLATTAIAFLSARPNSAVLSFVIGIIGVTMVAMNLALLLGQVVGLAPAVHFGPVVGTAPQVAVAMLGLGLSLTLMAWSHDWGPATIPEWAATAAGLAAFVTVMLLWWAFILSERNQNESMVADAAHRLGNRVAETLNRVDLALKRVADVSTPTAVGTEPWTKFVSGVVQSAPGLESIGFVAPGGTAVSLVRPPADSSVVRLQLAGQLAGWTGANPEGGVIRHFSLADSAGTVAVVLPRCTGATCNGFVVGLVLPDRLLSPLLTDSLDGFHHLIAWRGRHLSASAPWNPDLERTSIHTSVTLDDMFWDITVWPTAATRERANTDLPGLLLTFGLIVSALLPVTLQLARTLLANAQTTERARLQLALGGATDRAWSWEIPGRNPVPASIRSDDSGSQEERNGRWTELIHPEDRSQVETLLNAHLDGRTPAFEAQYRVRDSRDEWAWRVDRGRVAERGVYGAPLRMMGVSGDVSARRRSEEQRESSEIRFRAAFDSAHQFRCLLNLDCRVIEANPTALSLLGPDATIDALRDTLLWEAGWWPGDKERQWARTACDQATQGLAVAEELEVVNSAGETMVMDFSIKPILGPDGQVAQLFAEGRDITHRRRAEAELREVETLTTMGRIAARVAHEINNPLAGIQNAFLLVRDAIPRDHPHYAYVGAVEREIARIADVTRQLYETYRPETVDSGHTGVRTVIGDAVAFLKQVNRASKVTIDADLESVPAKVSIPESVLRQSVYNLVQNAVEASPQGGTVTVQATLSNGDFVLRVRDEGPGVPLEARQRIFEPFVSTKSREVSTGGMGIGLSLVRRSVQAVGGSVDIVDPPVGGAEFVVKIPIASKRNRGVP